MNARKENIKIMTYTISTTTTWAQTMKQFRGTFSKWGISEWETNQPRGATITRRDQSEDERRVTLSYKKGGKWIDLAMDKQSRAVDNLRVLYLAIESMRMNEKRGIGDILESAYLQLAAPEQKKNPYEVLQIYPNTPLAVAEAVYKTMVKKAHPDTGGSIEEMKELNEAIDAIRNNNL